MIIKSAFECNIGKMRPKNEDNYFFYKKIKGVKKETESDKTGFIKVSSSNEAVFAVFDGMGGEKYGEIASYTAASEMLLSFNKKKVIKQTPLDFLNSFFNSANLSVCEKANELSVKIIGTTAAVLYLNDNTAWFSNIGDSRIYLFRDNTLKQLSIDHCRTKLDGSKSSALTQFLGVDEEEFIIEPFIDSLAVRKKDVFLLCSDGLTDMVTDEEISQILSKGKSIQSCVSRLMETALKNGGKDNVTVSVCKVLK